MGVLEVKPDVSICSGVRGLWRLFPDRAYGMMAERLRNDSGDLQDIDQYVIELTNEETERRRRRREHKRLNAIVITISSCQTCAEAT